MDITRINKQIENQYLNDFDFMKYLFDSYEFSAIGPEMERVFFNNTITDNENFIVRFSNHSFDKPRLTPMQCRKQNINYSTSLFVDIEIYKIIDGIEDSDPIRKYKWRVCEFPVMLGSSICHLHNLSPQEKIALGECDDDPLGYFIVRGLEKNVVCQEKLMTNIIISKEKTITGKTFSIVECRSVKKNDGLSQVSLKVIDDILYIYFTDKEIHLRDFLEYACKLKEVNFEEVKMKFLGAMKHSEMHAVMLATMTGKVVKRRQKKVADQSEMTETQKTTDFFEKRDFDQTFLPHINKFENKIEFLLLMVKEILKAEFGLKPLTNRDSYKYKRLEPVGTLINQLFSKLFSNMCNEANRSLSSDESGKRIRRRRLAFNPEIQKIDSIVNFRKLQKELDQSFATSSWWATGLEAKSGVVVMMEATNRIRQIANLRKISVGSARAFTKIVNARRIGTLSYGLICPAYITEGETAGLVKELALSAYITLNENDKEITKHMKHLREEFPGDTIVLINGRYSGTCDGEIVKLKMLDMRRKGTISPFASITLADEVDEVETITYLKIFTNVGRIVRPLIILGEKNIPAYMYKGLDISKMTTKEMLNNGIIEFIDPLESETLYIAITPEDLEKNIKYTHLEINPSWMFGVIANLQNFVQHMPGPRSALTTGKLQQQIGAPFLNFKDKDTDGKALWYPQRPLMRTEMYEQLAKLTKEQIPELGSMTPSAQNVVIAITPFMGFNVDDAIVVNQKSLDMGLFRSDSYEIEEFSINNLETSNIISNRTAVRYKPVRRETIMYPSEKGFSSKYVYPKERVNEMLRIGKDSITQFGIEDISELGKLVREFEVNGEIYMEFERTFEMKQHIKHGDILAKYDVSEVISKNETGSTRKLTQTYAGYEGNIEKVDIIGEGIQKTVRIRVKTTNITEAGDKLLAPYAQKGVTGIVVPPEDLPFDPMTGIIPDLIISPSAFPSRMTIGMLLDIVMSKAMSLGGISSISGKDIITPIFDEIPSTNIKISNYSSRLKSIINQKFPNKYKMEDKLTFRDVEDIKQSHPRISIENTQYKDLSQWQKDLYDFLFPVPNKSDTIGFKNLTLKQHRSWRRKILEELDIEFPLKENLTYNDLTSDEKDIVEKFYLGRPKDEIISESYIVDMKYPVYDLFKNNINIQNKTNLNEIIISTDKKGIYELTGDDLAIYWIKNIEKRLPTVNSSAFAKPHYEDFVDFMKKFGETEKIEMISGITGEPMESTITLGLTSYYVLKHMAKDKMRARDTGKKDAMNKQAVKGKVKGGAVRLGEMECAVMKAHGSAEFLRERMRDVTDMTTMFVCENCHEMCYTTERGTPKCDHCGSLDLNHTISKTQVPYSLCMLYHYNMAMGITTKMTLGQAKI